ncbi:MAG: hypothetical protein ACJ74F_17675 [Mycobacterium sp.]|jgi:hypothetical protein|uniref:hypothetical protein n=1 Tax=Mycobacterium sp. TaxID=1785 RepID=UPI00389A008E
MSTKKIQRLVLAAGALTAVLAVSTGVAATASAEPIGPNGPASKPGYCAVVNTDSNGNETVTYVPTGTRSGLSYCGRDGEWHFGWLVDEMVAPPTGGGKGPVKGGGVGPVLTVAK